MTAGRLCEPVFASDPYPAHDRHRPRLWPSAPWLKPTALMWQLSGAELPPIVTCGNLPKQLTFFVEKKFTHTIDAYFGCAIVIT